MKAKINRGGGFKGALSYVLDEKKGASIVGGTVSGTEVSELSSEFGITRGLRPDCQKPVWHTSLALPAGEHLSDEEWQAVTADYMKKMGFSEQTVYIVVRHTDTDHDHVHIIASRVGLDSQLWHGGQDVFKSLKVCQQLEQTHGLTITPGYDPEDETRLSSLKRGEIEMALKSGEAPPKLVLQAALKEAMADRPDTAAFIERLQAAGVGVRPNIASTGTMNGFSFEYGGVAFPASKLGEPFRWKTLQKNIDYDPERDRSLLESVKEQNKREQEHLSGTPAPGTTAPAPDQYKKTLDFMAEVEPGAWRFERGRRVVVQEIGESAMWCAKTDTAARAAVQLALAKGWSDLKIQTPHPEHAARLYATALQAGYPPHVVELTANQLDEDQIRRIQNECGYKQNTKGQGIEQAAVNVDQRTDQRLEATTEPERGESGSPDRATGPSPGSTVGRGQEGDHRRGELLDEEARRGAGSVGERDREAARSDRGLEIHHGGYSNGIGEGETATPGRDEKGLGGGDQHEPAVVAGAADRVHALAAPAIIGRENSTPGVSRTRSGEPEVLAGHRTESTTVAPHIRAKQRAWHDQHGALQAPAYRLTLTARKEGLKTFNMGKGQGVDGQEKFYTPDEVQDLLPQLSRHNARGYDIYITPISDQNHYIVLDDADNERLKAMQQKTGILPVLVQESSPNNLQAIIVASKRPEDKNEQSNANYVVQTLNKAYGDPHFSGVVHPFRLSGFMNQKPAYQEWSKRPITRPRPSVIQLTRGPDATLDIMLEKQREQQQERQHRVQKQARLDVILATNNNPRKTNMTALDRYYAIAATMTEKAEKMGAEVDWSRVDYAAACEMLKDGYFSENDIAGAIEKGSPGIDDRKQRPEYYAQLTVQKAADNPQVQAHLNEHHQDEQNQGPQPGQKPRH